jgi:hypothetical protein
LIEFVAQGIAIIGAGYVADGNFDSAGDGFDADGRGGGQAAEFAGSRGALPFILGLLDGFTRGFDYLLV